MWAWETLKNARLSIMVRKLNHWSSFQDLFSNKEKTLNSCVTPLHWSAAIYEIYVDKKKCSCITSFKQWVIRTFLKTIHLPSRLLQTLHRLLRTEYNRLDRLRATNNSLGTKRSEKNKILRKFRTTKNNILLSNKNGNEPSHCYMTISLKRFYWKKILFENDF